MNNTEKFLFRFTPLHGVFAFLSFFIAFTIGYSESIFIVFMIPIYWLVYAHVINYTYENSLKINSKKLIFALKIAFSDSGSVIALLMAISLGSLIQTDSKNLVNICLIFIGVNCYYEVFYTSMKQHYMHYFTAREKYLSDKAKYHMGDKVKVCMDKEDTSIFWNPVAFEKLKDLQNEGRVFEITEIYWVDTDEIFYDIVVEQARDESNQIFKEVPERILFKEDEKEA